jgi:hypothetical protein
VSALVTAASDAVVLDEANSPEGKIELVAYEDKGVAWIGIRYQGSSVTDALGLHTGSGKERFLEVAAGINGTWGVAFGAVSPEVIRVSVRNERGESFDGRILSLPPSFQEEYRAAWGVAARCREECSLIGYDERGREIDLSMLRPRRRDLSDGEILELIRTHCDRGLRYNTWALRHMRSIAQQAPHVRDVERSTHALAQVLAFLEGADDDRVAASAISAIVQRYVNMVEAESWEPPFGSSQGEDGH